MGKAHFRRSTAVTATSKDISTDPQASHWRGAATGARTGSGVLQPANARCPRGAGRSKAEEVVSIDLAGKTSIADWMIVATGRSTTQVGALADRIVRALKDSGAPIARVEGVPACDWVLIDAGDLIIHLFRPEVRQFYNLEKMWGVDRPGEKRAEA